MTIQEIETKLEYLRSLFSDPMCKRSKTSIELEGKLLKIALEKKKKRLGLNP